MGRCKVISLSDHNGRCEEAGMSTSACCRKYQLALATFYYWCKKITGSPFQSTYIEIKTIPPRPLSGLKELQLDIHFIAPDTKYVAKFQVAQPV